MGYCTKEEVAADFKDITFDTASSVKADEVDQIIEQESGFIDSMIASVYVTPVDASSSPKSFLVLKRICIFLAADRVRHILYTKTGSNDKDQDTKGLYSLSRNPRKDLQNIQDGTVKLLDAIQITSGIGFDTGCKEEPLFSMSKQQW